MRDRFIGCLLGHAVADAIGAPFEGMPATAIWYEFGGGRKIIAKPPVGTLCYTDDTQMTIGVGEALLADGTINSERLRERFVANYDRNRAYGQGARKVIHAMADTGDGWQEVAATVFPGGSLGNGAAMRVAPVAMLFHDDLDRVDEEATKSALPTHHHLVGIDGARVLAVAIALALRSDASVPFDRQGFYDELLRRTRTPEFREQLTRASRLGPDDSAGQLGCTLEAHRSVVTSIEIYAQSHDSWVKAISSALSFGDDVDTVGAMAGALVGARLGTGTIPQHLVGMLENGHQGRDYIQTLAAGLFAQFERRRLLASG